MATLSSPGGITPQDTISSEQTGVTNPAPSSSSFGQWGGLIFLIGIGGLMLVASENQVAAAVAQGILLIALLLVLITLMNGKQGLQIITG